MILSSDTHWRNTPTAQLLTEAQSRLHIQSEDVLIHHCAPVMSCLSQSDCLGAGLRLPSGSVDSDELISSTSVSVGSGVVLIMSSKMRGTCGIRQQQEDAGDDESLRRSLNWIFRQTMKEKSQNDDDQITLL